MNADRFIRPIAALTGLSPTGMSALQTTPIESIFALRAPDCEVSRLRSSSAANLRPCRSPAASTLHRITSDAYPNRLSLSF